VSARGSDVVDSRTNVFDAALDAIVTIDHDGRIVEFNTAAEKTFGLSREAVRGELLADTIIPPRFRDAHRRGLRRYLDTGEAMLLGRRIEVTALRADGAEFPVELAVTRVPNVDPPLFTGFLRDLTEPRRLERRRAAVYNVAAVLASAHSLDDAADQLLKTLTEAFDAAIGGLWVIDSNFLRCMRTYRAPSVVDDSFERVSQSLRFAQGVGLPGRVWQSPKVHWVEDMLEDDNLPRGPAAARHGLRTAFAFPIRAGDDMLAVLEFFRPSVSERDDDLVQLSESIGHQIAQFIGRKRAEADHAQMLVQEQRARLEAEEANRAKDDFLAVVSHELRTPLNAVLGWAAMLKSGTLPEDKRQKAIDAIERSARMQTQIIEDLLDATRIIRGKLTLTCALVDASAVVQAAIDMMQLAAQDRRVAIISEGLDETRTVWADRGRLQQITWNLLSNAVKFTPAGGTVRVSISKYGSRVQIVVRDDGVGISDDLLPHIFERFRQGQITGSAGSSGLGLGLAIVQRLVDLHGGSVRAASLEGKGSTFTVSLPIDAGPA
jgi:PAS domain S-box-containing protein